MCLSFVSDRVADIAAMYRRDRLRDHVFLVVSIARRRQEKILVALRLVHRLLMRRKHLRMHRGMRPIAIRAVRGRIL